MSKRFLIISILIWAIAGETLAQSGETTKRTGLLRTQVYIAQGQLEKAENELLALKNQFPEDATVLNELAAIYQRQGQTALAEALYRQLITRFPNAETYRQDLAYLLADAGRYADVADLLSPFTQTLIEKDKNLASVLANAYYRLNNIEQAEFIYRELLKDQTDRIPTLLLIADGYLAQNQPDRATNYYEQILAENPNNYRALKGLGFARYDQDRAHSEALFLQALPLDPNDFEVVYQLGELNYARSKKEGQIYYYDALRRLEKNDILSNYQRSVKARMLARTGQRTLAETLLRDLIAQNPDHMDFVNDLVELYLDDNRNNEALTLLDTYPNNTTERSRLQRARIYMLKGWWHDAVQMLHPLTQTYPNDEFLLLDLAESLEKSGNWSAALTLHDSLLLTKPCRPTLERAYEMRRELRQKRGTAVGLDAEYTGLSDGYSLPLHAFSRIYFKPGLGITIDATDGLYRDRSNFDLRNFKGWNGELGATLHLGASTLRDLDIYARKYFWRVDEHLALGGRTHLNLGKINLDLSGDWKHMWTTPADAVIYEGLYDKVSGSIFVPLVNRLYLSGQGSWRRFWIFKDQYFGKDHRLSTNLGWEALRRPYGASNGLRAITFNIGYDRSRATQEAQYLPYIALQNKSTTLVANMYLHFIFDCRSTFDLWGYTGRDLDRNIGWGKLYGFGGRFHLDVSKRISFGVEGLQSSENLLQTQAGIYREARARLVWHFAQRNQKQHHEDNDVKMGRHKNGSSIYFGTGR